MGVGLALGPCIIDLMVKYFDYTNTMIIQGALLLFASSFCVSSLPERLDLRNSNRRGGIERNIVNIPYRSFFKNLRVVMALIAVSICASFHFYINSDTDDASDKLTTLYGTDLSMYAIQLTLAVAFAASAMLFGFISTLIDNRLLFSSSFVFLAGALYILDEH